MPKNKTRKIKTLVGFDNIPKTIKTLWSTDQFGKRKVIDLEKFLIRNHIDNKGLASDYKINTEQHKFASDEIKRRLALQIKKSKKSKRLFAKKTRKKYKSKTIATKIKKMPIKKAEKLYYYLLENDKIKKSTKK